MRLIDQLRIVWDTDTDEAMLRRDKIRMALAKELNVSYDDLNRVISLAWTP